MQYLWPGNIRELENVIQSSMILTNEDFLTKEFLNINWDENFFKKKEKKEEKEFFIKVAFHFRDSSILAYFYYLWIII